MTDQPWQNPWVPKIDLKLNYLTTSKKDKLSSTDSKNLIETVFYLSDKKVIRSRQVYNIITLISEVSGFLDIWIIGASFLLGTFY